VLMDESGVLTQKVADYLDSVIPVRERLRANPESLAEDRS